jgi:hypothetical protein
VFEKKDFLSGWPTKVFDASGDGFRIGGDADQLVGKPAHECTTGMLAIGVCGVWKTWRRGPVQRLPPGIGVRTPIRSRSPHFLLDRSFTATRRASGVTLAFRSFSSFVRSGEVCSCRPLEAAQSNVQQTPKRPAQNQLEGHVRHR